METKHTPGPWKLIRTEDHPIQEGEQISFIQLPNKPCLDVSTVENDGYTRHEHEANARLIAAAPEMIEALTQLYETARKINPQHWTDPYMANALQFAGRIISKAIGED